MKVFRFTESGIKNSAPEAHGVYYIGEYNPDNTRKVHYIGEASGNGVTIQSRLLDHLRDGGIADCNLFAFETMTGRIIILDREKELIDNYAPKYNVNHNPNR